MVFEAMGQIRSAGGEYIRRYAGTEILKLIHGQRRSTNVSPNNDVSKTDLEKMAAEIIEDGIRRRASDLHIEVRSGSVASVLRENIWAARFD